MTAQVDVLCFERCPHGEETLRRTREAVSRLLPGAEVRRIEVAGEEEARRLGFPGSPTVRVAGTDIEGRVRIQPGLRCRLYSGSGDMPPDWMIEAGLLRYLAPKHLAFLCVANSARSQLAEALARHLAPPGVRVSSAGSRPGAVRAEALRVLEELGIDGSSQRSKGVDELEVESLEAIVTLCDEEVCPVLARPVPRLHWGMPDPGAARGGEEVVLGAFRAARDELRRRLKVLFDAWPA